jgi:pimeloyl-ACP methyl ester carboxylesterase
MTIQTGMLSGLRYGYEVSGDPAGPPVLILHGWGGQIESMANVAAGLAARGYAIHVLDLPGFGRSAPPPDSPTVWGVPEYAQFVAGYLQAAGLNRPHLIGHSFGGRISIVLGADYAAQVGKIVLTSSAGVLSPPTLRDKLVGAGKAALRLPGLNLLAKPISDIAKNTIGSDDLRAAGVLEPVFRKVVAQDLVPYAARISAPTLLIWGDQDTATPLWQAHTLEKTIPDAGLVVFQGAGHFAYQERGTDFIRIVDTFFKGA